AVREIVSNVIRHAGASHLTVALELTADRLVLQFSDDGSGLPAPALAGQTTGFGLHNLRHRIRDVGGTLSLANTGHGSSVSISIPLHAVAPTPDSGLHERPEPLRSVP
ncbi:MAG TPA: ATP-binding protein, partial [Devosia sp.]|nr:ATP-binding protein [Devosia sp.]